MKKVKKIFAALLALTMVLGMGVTTLAAPQGSDKVPRAGDTVTVKINGITGSPTVVLYQIASGVYGPNGNYLIRYNYAPGAESIKDAQTSQTINNIAKGLQAEAGAQGKITPLNADTLQTDYTVANVGSVYEKEVPAGAYIAVITGANDGYVYNAILLTATYNEQGILEAGEIDAAKAMYGTTATAKRTKPNLDKTVTGTENEGTGADAKATASVGDVLHYTITPTMPTYPVDASNKTFFISDTMSKGLSFDYSTLTLAIPNKTIDKRAKAGDASVTQFVMDTKVIAESVATIEIAPTPEQLEENPDAKPTIRPIQESEKATGFYLNFYYDTLFYSTGTGNDTVTGNVYVPTITYDAVLNEEAVVGGTGNTNDAKLYYSNNPTKGQGHTDPQNPPDSETATTSDANNSSKTVYTYQLAFRKTGKTENGTPVNLPDAVFGIYTTKTGEGENAQVSGLIDIVKTNTQGLAVSSKVKAGTYYIKEIAAPTGYSLNNEIYPITANATKSTTTVTTTTTETKYTTDVNAAANDTIVGYIKGGVFYKTNVEGSSPAYILSQRTRDDSISTTSPISTGGTTMLADSIPNTQLSALPSTGGIGTTIFTIGGCALMIIAAGLYFATRRKNAK